MPCIKPFLICFSFQFQASSILGQDSRCSQLPLCGCGRSGSSPQVGEEGSGARLLLMHLCVCSFEALLKRAAKPWSVGTNSAAQTFWGEFCSWAWICLQKQGLGAEEETLCASQGGCVCKELFHALLIASRCLGWKGKPQNNL